MEFEKVEQLISEIHPEYRSLLILNLFKSGKLKFEDISKQYVKYLESKDSDNRDLICELCVSLVQHRNPKLVGGTKSEAKEFMENKAVKAIRRTNIFPETATV